jgi:hypothetical protein
LKGRGFKPRRKLNQIDHGFSRWGCILGSKEFFRNLLGAYPQTIAHHQ